LLPGPVKFNQLWLTVSSAFRIPLEGKSALARRALELARTGRWFFTPTAFSLSGETVANVPESSTWAMMILGFAGIGVNGLSPQADDRSNWHCLIVIYKTETEGHLRALLFVRLS
jgi:hypothetical protein